jgi:hypothetical protein
VSNVFFFSARIKKSQAAELGVLSCGIEIAAATKCRHYTLNKPWLQYNIE